MNFQKYSPSSDVGRQAGISLVEILVTVLILTVGSLGIASLQLAGLKYSSGSFARTQITILSDDIVNRLKANRNFALNRNVGPGAVLDEEGNLPAFNAGSPYEIAAFTGEMVFDGDCLTVVCDDADLASFDLATWIGEVARTVPSGEGRITIVDRQSPDGIDERQFVIEIRYRQVANNNNPEASDEELADAELQTVAYRVSL